MSASVEPNPTYTDARGNKQQFTPLTVFGGGAGRADKGAGGRNGSDVGDFRCEVELQNGWYSYVLLRRDAWATHTVTQTEARSGIRSVITKTETRGPYTRPHTVYFVHTKTAFSVKGCCKRFSDFKELDTKLRKNFQNIPEFPPSPMLRTMEPEFVQERRKLLQKYLDAIMAMPEVAKCSDLHEFLSISNYNAETDRDSAAHASAYIKPLDQHKPGDLLEAIAQCQRVGNFAEEAKNFNNLGVLYVESKQESHGIECMDKALELCREHKLALGTLTCLNNLGCVHDLLECQSSAVEYFRELFSSHSLSGNVAGQIDGLRGLALTSSSNGDNYEAVEHLRKCLNLCKASNDKQREAACLFLLGSIYYEAGEVRQAVEAFEQCMVLRRVTRDKIGMAESLNKLGLTYAEIGYDLRAIDYFEQALVICVDSADLQGQAVCLQNLGNVFKMQKDHHLAVDLFERALNVRGKLGDEKGRADCHDSLGQLYYGLQDYSTAINHYTQSLQIRNALSDRQAEADCHKSLGTAKIRINDMAGAIAHFESCLRIHSHMSDRTAEVDALVNLGLAHFKAGNNARAVEDLERSLGMFDELGDRSGKATCLDHLGNVHHKLGQAQRAIDFYGRAISIKREIGEAQGEARDLVRIGLEQLGLNQLQPALRSFSDALRLFERLDDDNGISVCYENLGDTYMKMNNLMSAIENYEKCLPIKVEMWDKPGEATCMDNLGLAYYSLGELRPACDYYEQALAIWKAESDQAALMECYESLGGVYFQLGEHVRSIECYAGYLALSKEVGDGASDHEILLRLGLSHSAIGEYKLAVEFLQQALSFYSELGDLRQKAVCLQHIGSVRGKLAEFDTGMRCLEQCLRVRMDMHDSAGVAECLQEMGLLCYNKADNAQSRYYFEQAQRVITQSGDQTAMASCVMHIGQTLAQEGMNQEAIAKFNEALSLGESAEQKGLFGKQGWQHKVDALSHLGQAQTAIGDRQAISTFERALQIWRQKGNRAGEASILEQLAQAHFRLGDIYVAKDYLERCLALRERIGDKRGQGDTLIKLASACNQLGEREAAIGHYQTCLEVRKELDDKHGQAECLNTLGLVYGMMNRHDEGAARHEQALELRREVGDATGEAESRNNLGVLRSFQGDMDAALNEFDTATEMMRKNNDTSGETKCLINKGTVLAESSDFDGALQCYEQAMRICERTQSAEDSASIYNNIGSVYCHKGNSKQALEYYSQALILVKQSASSGAESECLHNIGATHFNMGDNTKAVWYFSQSLSAAKTKGDVAMQSQCIKSLQAAYIRQGDAAKAAETMMQLNDFMTEQEVIRAKETLEATLASARHSGDSAQEASTLRQLGALFNELSTTGARDFWQAALKLDAALGDSEMEAVCYCRLGSLEAKQDNTAAAMDLFTQGLHLVDSDRTGEHSEVEGELLYEMGLAQAAAGLHTAAVDSFSRSRDVRDALDLEDEAQECLNRVGVVQLRLGRNSEALTALQTAAGGPQLEESGRAGHAGLLRLATTLVTIDHFRRARRVVGVQSAAIGLWRMQNDHKAQAESHVALARAYAELQEYPRAHEALERAIELRQQVNDPQGASDALKWRGLLLLAVGDVRQSVQHLESYLKLVGTESDRAAFLSKSESGGADPVATCAIADACVRLGDAAAALEHLRKGLDTAMEAGNRAAQQRCLFAFGRIYLTLALPERALGSIEQALAVRLDKGADSQTEVKGRLASARAHFQRGSVSRAVEAAEAAYHLSQSMGSAPNESLCCQELGMLHWHQGDSASASKYLNDATTLMQQQLNPLGEAVAIVALSAVQMVLESPFNAIERLSHGLAIARRLGAHAVEGDCLLALSRAYRRVGKPDGAASSCEQALQLARSSGCIADQARALDEMGRISLLRREAAPALGCFEQAIALASRQVVVEESSVPLCGPLAASALRHAARAHQQSGSQSAMQQAERSLGQALALCKKCGDLQGEARTLCALALLKSSTSASEADNFAQSALALYKRVDRRGVAKVTRVMGAIAIAKRDVSTAVAHLQQSQQIMQPIGDKRGEADALELLAAAHPGSRQGIVYYEQALVARRLVHDHPGESLTLAALADLCGRLGETAKAGQLWRDCKGVRDDMGDSTGAQVCITKLQQMGVSVPAAVPSPSFSSTSMPNTSNAQAPQAQAQARAQPPIASTQHSAAPPPARTFNADMRPAPAAQPQAMHAPAPERQAAPAPTQTNGAARAIASPVQKAATLFQQAMTAGSQNRLEEAISLMQQSLREYEGLSDGVRQAECHDKLARFYYYAGNPDAGHREFDAVKALRARLGKAVLKDVITDHHGRQELKKHYGNTTGWRKMLGNKPNGAASSSGSNVSGNH